MGFIKDFIRKETLVAKSNIEIYNNLTIPLQIFINFTMQNDMNKIWFEIILQMWHWELDYWPKNGENVFEESCYHKLQ